MLMGDEIIEESEADFVVSVGGMTCNNCVKSVKSAIYEVPNVENINVDTVIEAIKSSGYSAELVK